MPRQHENVTCEDSPLLRNAAANSAWNKYKLATSSIRFRMFPNNLLYLIHFQNGSQLYRWVNSAASSIPLLPLTGGLVGNCQ